MQPQPHHGPRRLIARLARLTAGAAGTLLGLSNHRDDDAAGHEVIGRWLIVFACDPDSVWYPWPLDRRSDFDDNA